MTTTFTTFTAKFTADLSRALCAAREYREPLSAGARRYQLEDLIDQLVGYWVWRGGRHRMSWPREVAEAAGEPERHIEDDESHPYNRRCGCDACHAYGSQLLGADVRRKTQDQND